MIVQLTFTNPQMLVFDRRSWHLQTQVDTDQVQCHGFWKIQVFGPKPQPCDFAASGGCRMNSLGLCKNARRWVVRRICHHPGNLTRSEDASAFHVCLNVISYQFHTVLRLRVVLRLLLQRIRDVDVVRKVRSLSDITFLTATAVEAIFSTHNHFIIP